MRFLRVPIVMIIACCMLVSCNDKQQGLSLDMLGEGSDKKDPKDGVAAEHDEQSGIIDKFVEEQSKTGDNQFEIENESEEVSASQNNETNAEDASKIPGKPVELFGIHFEDGGDNDYNDISYCFDGSFKIKGKSVVSTKTQNVVIKVKRISGADHTFWLEIKDENGHVVRREEGALARDEERELNVRIAFGHSVHGNTTYWGRHVLTMRDAQVELDKCRNTGG